jgi:hypothetical protein
LPGAVSVLLLFNTVVGIATGAKTRHHSGGDHGGKQGHPKVGHRRGQGKDKTTRRLAVEEIRETDKAARRLVMKEAREMGMVAAKCRISLARKGHM